ncbi:MAG: RHS repeat-associated core domain-containing protein [Chloroflexi bacterium]|nr:RHS repeat-associated core domain-containing protein [Chloroflexota bacterium]
MKQGSANVTYVHQDHLTGTSVMSDSNGASLGAMLYAPYGSIRSGSVPTDIKFTGQRLDGTGLYYYGARYYDAGIGRFISPDSIVQDFSNPQTFNRYSYVVNNPLKHVDPTGRRIASPGLPGIPLPPPVPPGDPFHPPVSTPTPSPAPSPAPSPTPTPTPSPALTPGLPIDPEPDPEPEDPTPVSPSPAQPPAVLNPVPAPAPTLPLALEHHPGEMGASADWRESPIVGWALIAGGSLIIGVGVLEIYAAAHTGPFAPLGVAVGVTIIYGGLGVYFKGVEIVFHRRMPDLPLIP